MSLPEDPFDDIRRELAHKQRLLTIGIRSALVALILLLLVLAGTLIGALTA